MAMFAAEVAMFVV
jgi:hypothetical protein